MALIATSFTMEIVLLIIGLYLFDGGIIRKFAALGLFITDLSLTLHTQRYVSDLSSSPATVNLFFTPDIQNAWALMLALLSIVTLAWSFVSVGRIIVWWSSMTTEQKAITNKWTFILDELV